MSNIVLQVENLWKQYRLGLIGTSTIRDDLARFWAKMRGKEDPTLKIGKANARESITGEYVWALQDINFEVKQGEVLGIIGKNGAGKSTLLKILSKVTQPTKGQIKTKGRIASLLEVGTGFHPELTGRENIFLNGAILGMTKSDIRSKFDEIVDFSGVGKYIDTPVKRYSSGMYVRLAFAVAAHLEPEILIVDEVLAVGDAEFQKKCLGKMKDVSQEGRTVLFVSHNMAAVQSLCSSGVTLRKGTLVEKGEVKSIIENYLLDVEQRSQTLLSELTDRVGNGVLRFVEVKFFDEKGVEKEIFEVGEQLNIKLSFETDTAFQSILSSRIDIGINNLMGDRVLWLSTSMYFDRINPNARSITFTLKETLLVQGTYNINLYCDTNAGIADWVVNVAKFEVIMTDYFGTGRVFPENQGFFIANYTIQN